jgi:amidase
MKRRDFLATGAAVGAALATPFPQRLKAARQRVPAAPPPDFELAELTIADLQQGMRAGKYTARSLCEQYLARIEALDRRGPALRAVLETNPEALSIAPRSMPSGRRRVRGPLHGIPVLIRTTSPRPIA